MLVLFSLEESIPFIIRLQFSFLWVAGYINYFRLFPMTGRFGAKERRDLQYFSWKYSKTDSEDTKISCMPCTPHTCLVFLIINIIHQKVQLLLDEATVDLLWEKLCKYEMIKKLNFCSVFKNNALCTKEDMEKLIVNNMKHISIFNWLLLLSNIHSSFFCAL